jgi:hypothetical protein
MLREGTPWVGLLALVAMFALPFVPSWFFDGPRTIKHRSRRHVCADCGAPWTDDHDCPVPVTPVREVLRGDLWRRGDSTDLVVRPVQHLEPDD